MSDEVKGASLETSVATAAGREHGVLAAWLFGSRAGGEPHAGSDADVAVLLARDADRAALTRLSTALAAKLGMEVDVVDLARATPVLGFEIVARGRRVYARDAVVADEAEERCLREYLDTAHMRRVQHHYLYGDPL
jgi:predicted nucleotidyltransferase